jgi:RNA polymerase sigma factor (sigma-70 family)
VSKQLEVPWKSGTLTGLSDAQLLNRFAATRDAASELAFRELVQRHGPMVLSVCRQILRHSHDADDAFQATFLVLVRKARSIRTRESLAPWLHSVAHRTAHRARTIALRYRPGVDEQVQEAGVPPEDVYKLDLRPLLQEELGRLPDKYRAPIVLCHLEGRTHEEAARLLCWPVGTVSGRLSRGRQLLRSRLERRGVAVPLAIFSATWLLGAPPAVATPLVDCTLNAAMRFAAAQSVSASILSLTHGVLKTMILRKLSKISVAVLLLGAVSGGAGVWAHWGSAPFRHPSQATEPASISTRSTEAAPAPNPNPAPPPKPQSAAGSDSMLADSCPAGRSLTQCDGDRPYCPISMAANALSRMFGRLHDGPVASK